MSIWEDFEALDFSAISHLRIWQGAEIEHAAEESSHVLKDRLVAGEVTACYGPPKAGKTFVAIRCAIAAALDLEFWGQTFALNGAPVIYVAAERRSQAVNRLYATASALQLEKVPENLFVIASCKSLRLTSPGVQRWIMDYVSSLNPALIIFDTYARIFDNNEDSSRDATDNIAVLEQIIAQSGVPCAALLVHHSGKDSSKGMRGSSAILASVTTAWRVSQKCGLVCLSLEAANDFDGCQPQHFEIQTFGMPKFMTNGNGRVSGVAMPTGATSSTRNVRQDVLDIWAGTESIWRTLKDVWVIFDESGTRIGESTINRALRELVDEGVLEKQRNGKANEYRIPKVNKSI